MVDLARKISRNFGLGEFLRSSTADSDSELRLLQLHPPAEVIENIAYLTETVLQPLRDTLGQPIRISSGYRSPELNRLVGGSIRSQHCLGEAVDCQLSNLFSVDPESRSIRERIRTRITSNINRQLRANLHPNYYVFALACLEIDALPIDQLIH